MGHQFCWPLVIKIVERDLVYIRKYHEKTLKKSCVMLKCPLTVTTQSIQDFENLIFQRPPQHLYL